jgi:hypothetical protein
VLIAGGTDGSSALAGLELYDPTGRSFSAAAGLQPPPDPVYTPLDMSSPNLVPDWLHQRPLRPAPRLCILMVVC